MNCLDCHDDRQQAPAVAVCRGCGAAVCREHAVVSPRRVVRQGAMGREEPVDPPARRVSCLTCDVAEQAATTLVARPLRLPRRR